MDDMWNLKSEPCATKIAVKFDKRCTNGTLIKGTLETCGGGGEEGEGEGEVRLGDYKALVSSIKLHVNIQKKKCKGTHLISPSFPKV